MLRTSGRFFFGHLANILAGKTSEAVTRHGHDRLKTFGVGKDRAPADWRGVLRQMLSAKLIERDRADRDRLIVTEEGRKVLRGEAPFALREDVVARKPRREKRAPAAPGDADADLLAALKALRSAMARAQRQPAYVIFPDRTLIEMASERPRDARRFRRDSWRRRRQAAEIRRGVPGGDPGPRRCLNCPKSRRCAAGLSGALVGARFARVEMRRGDLRVPFPKRFADG